MLSKIQVFFLQILGLLSLGRFLHCHGLARYKFEIKEAPYTRLCTNTTILTVNGQFPGPTLHVNTGDTIIVDVHNLANYNITIHWHGVKMLRYPWTDGPEYITQCPIQSGRNFSQKIIFSDEEGTLWWHSHSDWSRATIYGAIIVSPKNQTNYPFPDKDVPIILGEWWKSDIMEVYKEFQKSGGDPNSSDAYTINGQPGDLQPCSKSDAFKLMVDHGKTYLLRLINAVLQEILFFAIRNHQLTVVGIDGAYTKPHTFDVIAISPGQTINVLLKANQPLDRYYMAAKTFTTLNGEEFETKNATAIIQYKGTYTPSSNNSLPYLPSHNDTDTLLNFAKNLTSLADDNHPSSVPLNITKRMLFTLSINRVPCENNGNCTGPRNGRFASSVNNMSFVFPETSILEAYYNNISGVYGDNFPRNPPTKFNFTSDDIPDAYEIPLNTTKVKVLKYNSEVELVFQGTNLVGGGDHPMHLHGYSFYVVGMGRGNFDNKTDPTKYNLLNPPLQNTIAVPKNTWVAIRFKADNPGVWFMHCHIERHLSWGMDMAFIVKDGKGPDQKMLPPPPDMPPC